MSVKYSKPRERFHIYESVGYVEDTIRQRLVEMINEIIKEEDLPLDRADVQIEKKLPKGQLIRFPDIVIWKTVRIKPVCHIELKDPTQGWSPYDYELINDAQAKANLPPTSPFFATWNVNELVLWKTYEEAISWEEKRKSRYELVKIKDLREMDDPDVQKKIKEGLRKFLIELVQLLEGKKELPTIPIDEFFIYSLRNIVDASYYPIALEIRKKSKEDKEFRKRLIEWFVSQGWNAPITDDIEPFEKVARQFLYLLLNKVMFYNTLRRNFPSLEPIKLEEGIEDGEALKKELQKYFDEAERATKDFEAIFGFDFLERVPISKSIVPSLRSFINGFSKYNFSKLGYKDIGHIFDRLIPDEERHKLGQYFTNPDVVDIINTFCIRNPNAKIADFGCGAGTFLVRAYARIKYLSPYKPHKEIVKQLIGVDISKFAAHLTMINLAARDLSTIENPIVICKDFFDIKVSKFKEWKEFMKILAEGMGKENIKVEVPDELDAVVGNPPYTRQEELDAYIENYKEKLQQALKEDWGEDIKLSKRAGIYAYFFIYGLRFLKNRGRFGYITSNAWLDVDYGKHLQEFFLKHCKIVAIIETKERVFPDADINTVITILEKCNDEKEKNNNLVKFVKLKVTLKKLIPDDEKERFKFLEDFVKKIENTKELYEDEKIRIYPKLQSELWEEGYDEENKEYVGSKWGKYIRASEIFFKILEKGKELFVPLKTIAEIKRGFTTGVNEFFYLTEEEIRKYGIEKEFWMHIENGRRVPNYVIKNPRECSKLLINPKELKYRVLLIHKDKKELKGTNMLKYIEWGEKQGYHKNPTCASRKRWYDLGIRKPTNILFLRATENRPAVYFSEEGLLHDQTFYSIYPHERNNNRLVAAILNSSLINYFFREIISGAGKALGLGALWTAVYEVMNLSVLNPDKISVAKKKEIEKAFDKLSSRQVNSIFEELGTNSPEEVSLDKVKPDRRELDKIIMGEILGLTEEEQLEVYKAVIQLVKERIERAKSVEKEKQKRKKIGEEAYAEKILSEIDTSELKRFTDDYLLPEIEIEKTIELPEEKETVEIGRDLLGYFVKVSNEKIKCSSAAEAKWIYYSAISGKNEVKIPKNVSVLDKMVKDFEQVYNSISKEINERLEKYIPEIKFRKNVKAIIERKLNILIK
jgi:hypothetical protein